jgi:HAD superfamily phosphatase (TIGR01668 family)
MIPHILYALTMVLKHRKALRAFRRDPVLQSQSVLALDPVALRAQGVKILALDFDGVLAAHGEQTVSSEIGNWLHHCIQVFRAGHVFIVTNKPSQQRADYFEQNFSGVEFIFPKRKKPYPDSIVYILQKTGVNPNELLVVDDRLLTGILATIIAGVRGCYITKPIINLRHRAVSELFIMSLRLFERWAL